MIKIINSLYIIYKYKFTETNCVFYSFNFISGHLKSKKKKRIAQATETRRRGFDIV